MYSHKPQKCLVQCIYKLNRRAESFQFIVRDFTPSTVEDCQKQFVTLLQLKQKKVITGV